MDARHAFHSIFPFHLQPISLSTLRRSTSSIGITATSLSSSPVLPASLDRIVEEMIEDGEQVVNVSTHGVEDHVLIRMEKGHGAKKD